MSGEPSLRATVRQKRAIIFDLFHTLTARESTWSSSPTTAQLLGVSKEAWDEQLLERSRDRLIGVQRDGLAIVRDMAHRIDPSISLETIERAVRCRIDRFARAVTDIPEVTVTTLAKLKAMGKKIGLVSNADVLEVAAWDRSPIAGMFDSTVLSCYAGCAKPEREIYERGLRELGESPGDAMFVGDGGSDELQGAKTVGLTTVLITGIVREIWPERIEARKRQADFVIEALDELVAE